MSLTGVCTIVLTAFLMLFLSACNTEKNAEESSKVNTETNNSVMQQSNKLGQNLQRELQKISNGDSSTQVSVIIQTKDDINAEMLQELSELDIKVNLSLNKKITASGSGNSIRKLGAIPWVNAVELSETSNIK